MSIVKSLSVGNGDMFYIKHDNDNFTIIDCYMTNDNYENVIEEIKDIKKSKIITRFISTHPDQDHLFGLDYLDNEISILNFYCVKNKAIKNNINPNFEATFERYCKLRDDSKKAFYLERGCTRKWMNEPGTGDRAVDYGSSGLSILWPVLTNQNYIEELEKANNGTSFNDISIILKYSFEDGATVLWMGDLSTGFMDKIADDLVLPKTDVLFAPHHGRDTGKVPGKWLSQMDPKVVIIGEAPSEYLNYYKGYNTITQNGAGDITLECVKQKINFYVSLETYSVDFLNDERLTSYPNDNYIGTLNLLG